MRHLYKVGDYIFLTHFKKVVQLKRTTWFAQLMMQRPLSAPLQRKKSRNISGKGEKHNVEIDRWGKHSKSQAR